MKIKTLSLAIPMLLSASAMTINPNQAAKKEFDGKYYDSTQKLDFSDDHPDQVYHYYGDIQDRKGDELKEYLYGKISCPTEELSKYYLNYGSGIDGVGKWYQITDRNWELSEAIDPDNFKFITSNSDPRCKNTFFYNTYISDASNNDRTKAYSNLSNGSIDFDNKKKPSGMIRMDKEHLWAKSHGFEVTDNNFTIGAQTDLHHLVAADGNTNSAGHNNYAFGEVDKTSDKITVIQNYLADGSREVSGWLDSKNKTFEPTDEWKGDIARSLFYMATRYSEKKEKNTKEEPYLILTDDTTIQDDNEKCYGVQYNLTTLLKWNEQDPVSQYEIHRNNLIYHNVQNNRNPYIDHPEWARRVFAPDSFDTTFSNIKNSYNIHMDGPIKLDLDSSKLTQVTIDDPTIIKFEDNTITPLKPGKTNLLLQSETSAKTIEINVKEAIKVTKKPSETTTILEGKKNIDLNDEFEIENTFANETLVYESSNPDIISVDENGTLTNSYLPGKCTITVYLKTEKGNLKIATLNYENRLSKKTIILVIVLVVVLIFLLILFIVIFSKMKKRKRRQMMKKASKAIKSSTMKTKKGNKKK